MRMARKLGVITYRSALEWDGRFGRVRLESRPRADEDPFGLEFEVESYLEGHARRFVRRFDPNCYLYLSRSMDWFDLGEYARRRRRRPALAAIRVERRWRSACTTDILFPLQQQQQIADGLRAGGAEARVPAAGIAAGPRRVPGRHRPLRAGRRGFPRDALLGRASVVAAAAPGTAATQDCVARPAA